MSVFGAELFFPLGVFHTLANDFTGDAARSLQRVDAYNLFLVGRVKDGVEMSTASAGLDLLGQGVARSFPEYEHHVLSLGPLPKFGTSTSPMNEGVLATLGAVMMGMTGAVLLTVCLNLASMLLARGRARRKEFAIRLALGGGRMRIVRQLLIEGLVLSLAGGAIGVALGLYGVDLITSSLQRMIPITIVLDGIATPAVVAGAIVFCLLATAGFALGPALKHSRADILTDLKVQTGDDPAPRRWRFVPRNPLVAAQVALSLTLLIATGLFLKMALGAFTVDLGYRADDTVLAEVDSRLGGLDEPRSLDALRADRVAPRRAAGCAVRQHRRPRADGHGQHGPQRAARRRAGARGSEGVEPRNRPDVQFNVERGRCSLLRRDGRSPHPGPTVHGRRGVRQRRPSCRHPRRNAGPQAVAEGRRAGSAHPVGRRSARVVRRARQWKSSASSLPRRTQLFEREPRGGVFVPFAQGFMSNAFFHVRPQAASDTLVDTVRRAVREEASTVPLFGVRTFRTHMDTSAEYWMLKLSTSLFAFFGGLGDAGGAGRHLRRDVLRGGPADPRDRRAHGRGSEARGGAAVDPRGEPEDNGRRCRASAGCSASASARCWPAPSWT